MLGRVALDSPSESRMRFDLLFSHLSCERVGAAAGTKANGNVVDCRVRWCDGRVALGVGPQRSGFPSAGGGELRRWMRVDTRAGSYGFAA